MTALTASSTCLSWCGKTEPHSDADGHSTEVGSADLSVLFDSSRVIVGIYDDEIGPNVAVELDVLVPGATLGHLRDLAKALQAVADRIDTMLGAGA